MKTIFRYILLFVVAAILINWGARLIADVSHILIILIVLYAVGVIVYRVIKVKQDWR